MDEQRLFQHMLTRHIEDLFSRTRFKKEAYDWIMEGEIDAWDGKPEYEIGITFLTACDLAGCDPIRYRKRAQKIYSGEMTAEQYKEGKRKYGYNDT